MRSSIISVTFILMMFHSLEAQSKLVFTPEFQVYGGASVPVGNFGSTTEDNAAYAISGYAFGADLMMVSDKNLAVVGSINYSRNPINGAAMLSTNGWPPDYGMDDRSYSSTYMLLGARWNIPVPGPVRPFIMGQGGIAFDVHPGYVLSDKVESFVYSSSTTSSLALSLSAGARVFDSYDLSVRFQQSDPEFESDVSYTWFNGLIIAQGEFPFSTVLVVIGYAF